jgi:regulator of RNase E activity RraA
MAGGFAISHAYLRVVGIGGPVEIGGLSIDPGNLTHGDRHGIIIIPHDLAAKLPAAAARISEEAEEMIELSKKPDVAFDGLGVTLRKLRTFKVDSP